MKKSYISITLLILLVSLNLSSFSTSTRISRYVDNFAQQDDVSPSQASWNTVEAGSIIKVVNFERNMTSIINDNRVWLYNGRNVSLFENPVNLTIVVHNDLQRTFNATSIDRGEPGFTPFSKLTKYLHVNASIWNNETGNELKRLEIATQEFEYLGVLGPEHAYFAWKPGLGSSTIHLIGADFIETPQNETEALGELADSDKSLRTPSPIPNDFTMDDPFNVRFSPLGNFLLRNGVIPPFRKTFNTTSYDGAENKTSVGGRPHGIFLHDNFTRISETIKKRQEYAQLSGNKNTFNDSATAAELLTYTINTQNFQYFETSDIFYISYFSEFAYEFNEENSLNATDFNLAVSPTYYNLYEYTLIGNKITKVTEYFSLNHITSITAKGFDDGTGKITVTEGDFSRYNRFAFKFNSSLIDGYVKNFSPPPTDTSSTGTSSTSTSSTSTSSTSTSSTSTSSTGTTPTSATSKTENGTFFSFSNQIFVIGIIVVSVIVIILVLIFLKFKFKKKDFW